MLLTKDEALQDCLSVVKNELVAKVIVDKYLLCDLNRNYLESRPAHMWRRLATANAVAEKEEARERWAEEFFWALSDFKFVPGGRIMYALGNGFVKATLKNCYVIGIQEDSIKGIFDCAYHMAETYKTGGGVGIDISPLRPSGSPVRNAARFSSGATNFMDFFSTVTGMIGQHGRIGALLISIDVSHPEVENFVTIKSSTKGTIVLEDGTQVEGDSLDFIRYANISIKITDEFMVAVRDDLNFDLRWGGQVYKTIKARDLWNKVMENAWKRAEPGLLFWDAVNREYPAAQYDRFRPLTTNPCGELALGHGDSCDLGSITLGKFVRMAFEKGAHFDFETFEKVVAVAVRFLDNIISLEKCPLDFQQWANDNGRRLGLGIMGLGDVFMRMGVKFDSPEALELTEKICKSWMTATYRASCELAIEKGSFPVFDVERHMASDFIQRLPDEIKEMIRKTGIRNIGNMAIAPTGSLSTVVQCTPAIEPAFMIHYIRKTNLGTAKKVEAHEVWHETAREYAEKFKCDASALPDFFQGAHQVDNSARVRLQAVVQKYVDQSISNTFNLPRAATIADIGNLYMDAWKLGLKGVTVYREGSREGVLVSAGEKKNEITIHKAPKRPQSLDAKVHIIKPNGKTYTVFVGLIKDRPYEVFVMDHKLASLIDGMEGKIIRERNADGSRSYNFEAGQLLIRKLNAYEDDEASVITRLTSTALRHGTPLEFLIDQTSKTRTPINGLPKAIAKALSHYVRQDEIKGKFKCDKCHSDDIHWEGMCRTCRACGYSKCG